MAYGNYYCSYSGGPVGCTYYEGIDGCGEIGLQECTPPTPTNTDIVATPTNTDIVATPTNTTPVSSTPTNTVAEATPTNTTGGGSTPTNTTPVATPTNTTPVATPTNTSGATGNCYTLYNANLGTSGTIHWTDPVSGAQTTTMSGYSTLNVCSTISPYESPAADVQVHSCGDTCTSSGTCPNCYSATPTNTTGATPTNTYTATPTNTVQGSCYSLYNGNPGTSGTIHWTDPVSGAQTTTMSGYSTLNVCSIISPYESPAADVRVYSCGNSCTYDYNCSSCVPATPTNTYTTTPSNTYTNTPTNTVATPTNTVATPTNTVATPTNTVATPTNTVATPTNTVATPTNTTVVSTPTNTTPVATPTNTVAEATPTNTVATPTNTVATPTNTVATPTNTATATPTNTFTPTPTNTDGPSLPYTDLSIGAIVLNKGTVPVAGGSYSLKTVSQDGDPNATPANINMNSVNRPDKIAPHGIAEFRGYHHL